MILPHKFIPAGQIRLQQHVRSVGRYSQQVGEQQWHLEFLTRAPLQEVRALGPIGPAAVGQLVKLTVGGWEVCECGGNGQGTKKEWKQKWFTTFKLSAAQNQPYGGNVKWDELLYNVLQLLPHSPDCNLSNKNPSGNPNLPLQWDIVNRDKSYSSFLFDFPTETDTFIFLIKKYWNSVSTTRTFQLYGSI